MSVLECSTKGDKRFSAYYAEVEVFGKRNTIEHHYQLSKLFDVNGKLVSIKPKEAKGKKPYAFRVSDILCPVEYLSMWYKMLWVKYLDSNKNLVRYASYFDDFSDMFKGKNTLNCQADAIRQYIKEGRESVMNECKPFNDFIVKMKARR